MDKVILLLLFLLIGWLIGSTINFLSVQTSLLRYAKTNTIYPSRFTDYLLLRADPNNTFIKQRYLLIINFIYSGLTILLWLNTSDIITFVEGITLLILLGLILQIDLINHMIPLPLNFINMLTCLVIGVQLHDPQNVFIGGMVGFLVFLIIYIVGKLIQVIVNNTSNHLLSTDPIGFGDIILCTSIGLLVGWPSIQMTLLLTILISGAYSIFFISYKVLNTQYEQFSVVAFSPFIILSVAITYILPTILNLLNFSSSSFFY